MRIYSASFRHILSPNSEAGSFDAVALLWNAALALEPMVTKVGLSENSYFEGWFHTTSPLATWFSFARILPANSADLAVFAGSAGL